MDSRIPKWIFKPWIVATGLDKHDPFMFTGLRLPNQLRCNLLGLFLFHFKFSLTVAFICAWELINKRFLQGRIMKKAFGKLKLEHVVIGKGQFHQERAKPNILDVCIFLKSSNIKILQLFQMHHLKPFTCFWINHCFRNQIYYPCLKMKRMQKTSWFKLTSVTKIYSKFWIAAIYWLVIRRKYILFLFEGRVGRLSYRQKAAAGCFHHSAAEF